jgi:hypothetical protein
MRYKYMVWVKEGEEKTFEYALSSFDKNYEIKKSADHLEVVTSLASEADLKFTSVINVIKTFHIEEGGFNEFDKNGGMFLEITDLDKDRWNPGPINVLQDIRRGMAKIEGKEFREVPIEIERLGNTYIKKWNDIMDKMEGKDKKNV